MLIRSLISCRPHWCRPFTGKSISGKNRCTIFQENVYACRSRSFSPATQRWRIARRHAYRGSEQSGLWRRSPPGGSHGSRAHRGSTIPVSRLHDRDCCRVLPGRTAARTCAARNARRQRAQYLLKSGEFAARNISWRTTSRERVARTSCGAAEALNRSTAALR